MKPEEEVKRRCREIFDMRNVRELSRRTGYPYETLRRWNKNPLLIRAVDLIRLEQETGVRR